MIIFSHNSGPRLRYVGDHLSVRLCGHPAIYTDDPGTFGLYEGIRINYSASRINDNEIHIVPCGLLGETGIRSRDLPVVHKDGRTVLFAGEGDTGFDLLAACFYLLSRYEEYLPNEKDAYGRYDYRSSLAFREGFLSEPLVDEWMKMLKELAGNKFPEQRMTQNEFGFLPTYDIDEPWSFRHKSVLVNTGGMIRDLLGGRMKRINERRQVRRGTRPDPFDSYEWMDGLHRRAGLKPIYFFLVAGRRSRYDRNTDPRHPEFIRLVKQHAATYQTGLHPSWQSIDPRLLREEKETLEKITGCPVTRSRQHYIRFTLPDTYRALIEAGITEDFSMGYGSCNGFRASTSVPFYWYDLRKEAQTPLMLYPFCFMDANSFFEQRQDPGQAVEEMRTYYEKVKKTGGLFISIWHNTFLGTDPLFRGWREAYAGFVDSL